MRIRSSAGAIVLLLMALSNDMWVRGEEVEAARIADYEAVCYQRQTIYHSPQTPGYTCWVYAWMMPDESVMVTFTQATGPAKGRPRSTKELQRRLSWSDPAYDMTGLNMCSVTLQSTDGGGTWRKISEDPFRSPMNGAVLGAIGLSDGTILRTVLGGYLPYDNVPWTGLIQRSTDATKTWSKPASVLPENQYATYPSAIRQLRDGRLAMLGGVSRELWGQQPRLKWQDSLVPWLSISGDGGKTWSAPIEVVAKKDQKGWRCPECDATELPNGDLFWLFRRYDPDKPDRVVQWQGVTEKKGDTWTPKWVGPAPFSDTGLPNLLTTRQGVILSVANSRWTADAGKTWHELQLPGMPYYPKGVQLADGRILVFGHIGCDDGYGIVDQKIVMDSYKLRTR